MHAASMLCATFADKVMSYCAPIKAAMESKCQPQHKSKAFWYIASDWLQSYLKNGQHCLLHFKQGHFGVLCEGMSAESLQQKAETVHAVLP